MNLFHPLGGTNLLDPRAVLRVAELQLGDVVADYGCGNVGHIVFPAATAVGSGGLVYAIDVLKSVLSNIASRARFEGYTNIAPLWANLEKVNGIPLPDNSVDVGFLVKVLNQNHDKNAILQEVVRTIKPNGKLVIIDWRHSPLPFDRVLAAAVPKKELLDMGQKHGLQLVTTFEPSHFHYGLVFHKSPVSAARRVKS